MKKQTHLSAGFTLIEVAIVIIIGGILMATAATMLTDYLQEARLVTTQKRLQDIDNAIIEYQNINGALPCVASLSDTQDSATFGRQITDTSVYDGAIDCTAAIANAPTGTFPATGNIPAAQVPPLPNANTTGNIVEGAVPVRTLNLPDQEIADAWGDRFVYAVTTALTIPLSYNQTQGSIYVVDSSTPANNVAVPPGSAQYVIVSLGADRAGAFTIAGVKGGTPCPAGTTETPNCTYKSPKFVSTLLNSEQTGANTYDDFVTYHTLMNSTSTIPTGMIVPFQLPVAPVTSPEATCPPGWKSTGGSVAGCLQNLVTPPYYSCCQKQ